MMGVKDEKKKYITYINMNPGYKLKAETLMMASPNKTSSIQQVVVGEKELVINDMLDTSREYKMEMEEDSFKKIYDESHVVMIADSMFAKLSRVFHTENFQKYGVESLSDYYKRGGNVFILCIEGVLNVGEKLNELFGTKWKVQCFENSTIEATSQGEYVCGPYIPKSVHLDGTPYFISCPVHEGLYRKYMSNKDEFVKSFHEQDEQFEKLGIVKDGSLDCFNVEKSWKNYVKKYTDTFCICLHEGEGSEGNIVWYGDRNQTQTELSYVFCKLLFRMDQQQLGVDPASLTQRGRAGAAAGGVTEIDVSRGGESGDLYSGLTFIMAIVAVLIAVVAKLIGGL